MAVTPALTEPDEAIALRIAREVATGLHDIETILSNHHISGKAWSRLEKSTFFQNVLRQAVSDWQSSLNTHERTKLKAAALIEEWLLEANVRLHDKQEPLNAKVELAKLLKGIAGIGAGGPGVEGGGERFSVTINLGADQSLKFTKAVAPKVIEGEVAA